MQQDVPPGINYERVSRFFAENVPGADCELHFEWLSGGRSNLTYKVTGGGGTWVLRRPPLGHVLPTAHDMAREYRVLTALMGTNVPAPHTYALCEDTEVNDYPFYVMDYCEGVIMGESIPPGFVETNEERRQLSLALVRTMADLHAVDYNAVGLGDFGRPEGYVERQVRRWAEQWERNKTRELPEFDELKRRLQAAIPESPAPTIVHGDLRLGNLMIDPQDPSRVVALLDWEMCTLGDPLADLGWTFPFWGQLGDPEKRLKARDIAELTAREGFLTRAELAAEYARLTGRSIDHIDFYEVLAYYKLGVIAEGIWARYLKGATVGEGFDDYGDTAVNIISVGLDVANASENPALRGER